MKTPASSAAAMRNCPARAVTSVPSRLMVTVASGSALGATTWWGVTTGSAMRAPPVLHVDEELVAEHADPRGDRRGDRGAEHADGGLRRRPAHAGGEVVAHVHEQVE